jgi:hypothetical protein
MPIQSAAGGTSLHCQEALANDLAYSCQYVWNMPPAAVALVFVSDIIISFM